MRPRLIIAATAIVGLAACGGHPTDAPTFPVAVTATTTAPPTTAVDPAAVARIWLAEDPTRGPEICSEVSTLGYDRAEAYFETGFRSDGTQSHQDAVEMWAQVTAQAGCES